MKIWFQTGTIWLHLTFIGVWFFLLQLFWWFWLDIPHFNYHWGRNISVLLSKSSSFFPAHCCQSLCRLESCSNCFSQNWWNFNMSILNFFPYSLITWYNVLDLQSHSEHSLNDFLNYSYSHFTEAWRVLYKFIKRVSLYLQIHGLCPSYVLPLSFLQNKTFAFLLFWDNYNSYWD